MPEAIPLAAPGRLRRAAATSCFRYPGFKEEYYLLRRVAPTRTCPATALGVDARGASSAWCGPARPGGAGRPAAGRRQARQALAGLRRAQLGRRAAT